MDVKAEVMPERGSRHLLKLEGKLHPHWAGYLAAGFSERSIAIVSGQARQQDWRWTASFLVDFAESLRAPSQIDFVSLAQQPPAHLPDGPFVLSRFLVRVLPSQLLEVLVYGPDQSGFLARLFRQVSLLGLFPAEIDIDTPNHRIEDRFVFRGIGGTGPSPAVAKALEDMLRKCCQTA